MADTGSNMMVVKEAFVTKSLVRLTKMISLPTPNFFLAIIVETFLGRMDQ